MRDIVILILTLYGSVLGLMRPWLGVLALAVLGYLNPHRYAWGFSRDFPVYFIVFTATMVGLVFNGRDRQPFPWTRETMLFVSLLAWFTLTTFWSPDFPDYAREQWVKVMKIYVGIFPTLWLINSRERLRWLVITIALSFGFIGLKGGIFALATGFQHKVWGPSNTFYGGNNEIALALNMMLPLLILCAKEVQSKNIKIFFYVVFVFSIFSIISSWSRGGLITICAVLGAMIIFGKRKWLSIPVLSLAIFFALPVLPEEWFSRMDTIKTYNESLSIQGRFEAWQYAVSRAEAHPIMGGGFETFRGAAHDAHSAYFEVLGEHGFIALLLWLLLLFGTMLALERLRRQAMISEGERWISNYSRAIQISLLGYAVGGTALGVAYWDIFYHLIAISVLLKVMLYRAQQGKDTQAVKAAPTK